MTKTKHPNKFKSRRKPTNKQIENLISFMTEKLETDKINQSNNLGIKEGFSKSIEILHNKETDFNLIDVSSLATMQGKAIVSLSCDYMTGIIPQAILKNIPLSE